MAIVGSGDYRYERVESWPKLPKYWSFGEPMDAAINSLGEIYVVSAFDERPLTIWDADGHFVSSWGEGTFSIMPHGLYIAPNDNVWIVDTYFHIATEYTPDGKPIRTLGNKLRPSPTWEGKFVHSKPFNLPAGLAIAPNGEIYVADGYGAHRVHKFNSDGELLLSWGRQGTGPGEFALVHNVWIDRNNRVFICDCENNRIQIFDDQGAYLEQWEMPNPTGICIRDDIVYVAELSPEPENDPDTGSGGISIWTLEGELITRWVGNEGTGKGTVMGCHDLCVDPQGNIYVCDERGRRISKIDSLVKTRFEEVPAL